MLLLWDRGWHEHLLDDIDEVLFRRELIAAHRCKNERRHAKELARLEERADEIREKEDRLWASLMRRSARRSGSSSGRHWTRPAMPHTV